VLDTETFVVVTAPMSTASASSIRPYDKARDLDAITRVWREVGWISDDDEAAFVEPFFDAGRTLVYEQDGAAESACHITGGTIRYQRRDLSMAGVTAVTTSRVARKQGAPRRLLARMLAEEAADGMQVAGLGMFEQGFYDTLGFGTGTYDHRFKFDPTTLLVDRPFRVPSRIGKGDFEAVHACMIGRLRGHGGVTLESPLLLKCELGWLGTPFGLGYRDDDGNLTHFVYGEAKDENGPYEIAWCGYQTVDQLFELLALVKSLGDQVHTVQVMEPEHVQFQDLLSQPFRNTMKATGTGFHHAASWFQLRVLDLAGCVGAAEFPGGEVAFNLDLHDPAVDHLPDGVDWSGTAGNFVVTLGTKSGAEPGTDAALPTLSGGVGPFTRMLFGIRPASVLAATTDLEAPAELLDALDAVIHLPSFHVGWDF